MLNLIFPKFCIGCWKYGEYVCDNCLNSFKILQIQECIVCGKYSIDGKTHKVCQRNLTPSNSISPYIYDDVIKRYISKSKGEAGCIQALFPIIKSEASLYLLQRIIEQNRIEIIVPCPMTRKPFSYRLHNHSYYISKVIGKCFEIKVIDILQKSYGQSQKTKNQKDRYLSDKSIRIDPDRASALMSKRVLLVDDVSTTGSTLLYCSKKLLEYGAKTVCCYTICKDLMYNIS